MSKQIKTISGEDDLKAKPDEVTPVTLRKPRGVPVQLERRGDNALYEQVGGDFDSVEAAEKSVKDEGQYRAICVMKTFKVKKVVKESFEIV